MKRALEFRNASGDVITTVEIVKAARIKTDDARMYIESVDGGVRLLWSTGLLDEFKSVDTIKVIRENSDTE